MPRRGLTLVELLVVIIIMSTLVATVIPLMVATVEERRIREAARTVNAYLSAARARAIKTGRPVGVMIERMENEPGAAMVLSIAKQPAPFAGYQNGARVRLKRMPGSPNLTAQFVARRGGGSVVADPIPDGLLRYGDTMRINFRGPDYRLVPGGTATDSDNDGFIEGNGFLLQPADANAPLRPVPWPVGTWSEPQPYEIFRQPVRSSAPPLQLPDGVVIDLFGSGLGDDLFHNPAGGNDNTDPIFITFTPEGRVDYLRHNEGLDSPPARRKPAIERVRSPIYLLISEVENVGQFNIPANQEELEDKDVPKPNWLDPDAQWIAIAPQTGQVGTSVANAVQAHLLARSGAPLPQVLAESRRFAREMRTMGGR